MPRSRYALVVAYLGMADATELHRAVRNSRTCPLCVETGGPHNAATCLAVLDVMADQDADEMAAHADEWAEWDLS